MRCAGSSGSTVDVQSERPGVDRFSSSRPGVDRTDVDGTGVDGTGVDGKWQLPDAKMKAQNRKLKIERSTW